jgi:UDP-N-acetylmuramoyl-L-alanyl-D-glutamate--2,6-diaminopimelate ligase
MKLKKLFKDIPSLDVKGSKEVEITGLCNNSKLAAPGHLFIAKRGLTQSGNGFIPEAVAAGAVAVLTDLYDPFLSHVVQIIHPDVNALEGVLAERFYQYPSHQLLTVGITGTNGKTTTSYLVKHLLDSLEKPCGLIGTIECIVGKNVFPASQTTPDILTNQKLFREMVSVGCQAVTMEVSSHALDQNRVARIDFDAAIFTNLTQDHLDYHKTMEAYALAKSKLFTLLGKEAADKPYPKVAIANADSPWTPMILRECAASVLSYGLTNAADLWAEDILLHPAGTEYMVCYRDQKVRFSSPLIGKFNVYNSLSVFALGVHLGLELSVIASKLRTFKTVPGRLERVVNKKEKNIFVDYAHTDDALKNVLETLREVTSGRILCVFGCGGNRDRIKRPKMGAVAEHLADSLYVTSDNPRQEDPHAIIEEILSGLQEPKKVYVEADRKKAIQKAIEGMEKDDVLLIAGKGHETYQIFSHQTIHFDDRIVAKEYCQ